MSNILVPSISLVVKGLFIYAKNVENRSLSLDLWSTLCDKGKITQVHVAIVLHSYEFPRLANLPSFFW